MLVGESAYLVGNRLHCRIVDDHAKVRPTIDGKGGIFQFKSAKDWMAQTLDPFSMDVDIVLSP